MLVQKVLDKPVLMLNKAWKGFQFCTVRDAIVAITANRAVIVDHNYISYNLKGWERFSAAGSVKYHEWVRSPKLKIYAPYVIKLESTNYTIPRLNCSRENIFKRDKYCCQYCGNAFAKDKLTLDHVIPKSKGGEKSWENLVAACKKCNSKKEDKYLKDLGWALLNKPAPPKNYMAFIKADVTRREYWETFWKPLE